MHALVHFDQNYHSQLPKLVYFDLIQSVLLLLFLCGHKTIRFRALKQLRKLPDNLK